MKSSKFLLAATVVAALVLAVSAVSTGAATIGSGPAPQLGLQPIRPQTPAPGAPAFAPVPAPVPPAAAPPPVDPVTLLTHAQKDWYYKIRDLAFTSLSSTSMDDFRAGEQKLLAIKAPEALEPMALALYTPNTRWRSTFLQAVGQYARSGAEPANKLAVVYLEDIAVKDSSGVLRGKARANLLAKDTPRETSRLKYQLAYNLNDDVRDRAASLLADLKDQTALANLVGALTTDETRLNGYWVDSRRVQLDLRPAISQLQSMTTVQEGATAGGATAVTGAGGTTTAGSAIGNIMLPTVHVTEAHTTVSAPGGFTVTPDVQQTTVSHPEVLAALRSLTGQDFGYDKAAWMNWITGGHGDRTINKWQPSATWGNIK
jgi:hypothetical protein